MPSKIVYLSDAPHSGEVRLFESEPDVLTIPHVADLLSVAPATIRREIARGRLESVHVGSNVRVTKKALLRYIEEDNDG